MFVLSPKFPWFRRLSPEEEYSLAWRELTAFEKQLKHFSKMTVQELAEALNESIVRKDTVTSIVVEHMLNLKIARVQARATLQSGWLAAIVAPLVAFWLGYFLGATCSR